MFDSKIGNPCLFGQSPGYNFNRNMVIYRHSDGVRAFFKLRRKITRIFTFHKVIYLKIHTFNS